MKLKSTKVFIVTMEDMREGYAMADSLASLAITLHNCKKPVRAIEEIPDVEAVLNCPSLYTFLHEYDWDKIGELI